MTKLQVFMLFVVGFLFWGVYVPFIIAAFS